MNFIEIDKDETLVLRGAAVAMDVDHNGDMYYIMILWGGDKDGNEVKTMIAIPPIVKDQFLQVMNGMDAKREE